MVGTSSKAKLLQIFELAEQGKLPNFPPRGTRVRWHSRWGTFTGTVGRHYPGFNEHDRLDPIADRVQFIADEGQQFSFQSGRAAALLSELERFR